jgi:hypothetical protein
MIQASELRVGNLLTSKSWKGAHAVGGIIRRGKGSFTLIMNSYEHEYIEGKYFDLEEIPLTEEWLLKMGFDNRVETGVCVACRLGTNPVTGDHLIELIKVDGDEHFFYKNGHFKITTVHQLQNLYHALTGQELTIK